MTTEITAETREVTVRQPNIEIFALPDEQQFKTQMQAINRFQLVVQQTMIKGHDYGIIPGTDKPTLLKPGAEKIIKLLGLSDEYELVDRQEDWKAGFFRYLVRCRLTAMQSGILVSTGLGECNSFESKYRYRWVYENKLPSGVNKASLVKQERKAKNGGKFTLYRMDNEDIYSQVNTVLKMAKKRAQVDAALSAGRLSDIFTQDMEDLAPAEEVSPPEPGPVEPVNTQPADKPVDTITPAQLQKLFAAGKQNGYLEADLKAILEGHFKHAHSNELTKKEAGEFIELIGQGKHLDDKGELV